MSKKAKTIHMSDEIVERIDSLATEEGRTFSAMAERLLRNGLDSRTAYLAMTPAAN